MPIFYFSELIGLAFGLEEVAIVVAEASDRSTPAAAAAGLAS